jgi:hypothetical protein
MVFSIIAGIISLMLLLLLFYGSEATAAYTPLIVTVEAGMFAVIIFAIVRIYNNEHKMAGALADAQNRTLPVTTCPDYWVMSKNDNGSTTCSNSYKATGALTPRFTLPVADKTNSTIDLSDYDGRPLTEVCGKVRTLGAPWTDVRSECEAYNVLV